MNGQKSRAGANIRPAERDFIKKIPKLRGRGKNKFASIKTKPSIVNVGDLTGSFSDGDEVNIKTLSEKGLISKTGGRYPKVKLLGNGNLAVKILVSECQISGSAEEKIKKAGGQIK